MDQILAAAEQRARSGTMPAIEAMGLADRLREAGAAVQAIALYRVWTRHHPDDPLRYAIWFNLAVLLSNGGALIEAQDALDESIRLRPDFMPPRINAGLVQERLGDRARAVTLWQEVVQHLQPVTGETIQHKRTALKQLGRVLESAHLDPNAEAVLRHSLELDPHQRDVLQHVLALRARQCEWPVAEPFAGLSRAQLVGGLSPLSLAAYSDDPLLQLANAARSARLDIFRESGAAPAQPKLSGAGLRVGYLSSDLREHAIGFLMADLFRQHDPNAVQVFVYYSGHAVDDAVHRRIRATVPNWVDIAALSDAEAARRIMDDRIGILVDINGYTHGARSTLLSRRPAPVIVNWLGFPGTTGSPDHHYIIADDVIVPAGSEIYFSETVKRLPCYQPNDRHRVVAPQTPSRRQAGLPASGVVFCCFNGAQKFTPHGWRRWMAILHAVPDSVLWLMEGVATTNDRLRAAAAASEVDPARLIFAPRLSNPEHLARYDLADLFLDTAPYGAHTTASDALWMGVPVLTLAGRSFAARVCASLVTAAGLPEMVCFSDAAYVESAVGLARAPDRLGALRDKLRRQRDSCTLFDTRHLVRSLEALYAEMWEEARGGRLPRPDLRNLDVYHEIGVALDRDDVEMGCAADYREQYRAELARRDRIAMIPPDSRLWNGAPPPAVADPVTVSRRTARDQVLTEAG